MKITNPSVITNAPRDIMILFLKSYFSMHEEYIWSEDAASRKIVIADAFSVSHEDIEKLPHIIVQRSSIGIAAKTFSDNLNVFDFKNATKVKIFPMQCGLRVHCIAQNGLVAEKLASEVVCAVYGAKDVLKVGGFQAIELQQIGIEEPLELAGTTIHSANVSLDFFVSFVLKLTMKMPEEKMRKLSAIFIRSVQRWTETGNRMIEMEVK